MATDPSLPHLSQSVTFDPPTESQGPSAFQERIALMREALASGEDPLAAGAAAQQKALAGADNSLENAEGFTPDPDAEQSPAEPGDAPAEEVVAEEQPEEEQPEEQPEEEQPEPEALVVTLPGFAERGEAPLDVEVADEETAERLRQLVNNGLRRADYERKISAYQEDKAELDLIGDSLKEDPIAFIGERVHSDFRVPLIEYLLASVTDEEFTTIQEKLQEFDDPRERELTALRVRNERRDAAEKRRKEREDEAAKDRSARELVKAVKDLVPDSMDTMTENRYFTLAIQEIKQYARTHNLSAVPANVVPDILEKSGLLKMFGIRKGTVTAVRTSAAPPAGVQRTPVKAAAVDERAKAQAGQQQIKNRVAVRRAATAVAPPGTGAAPSRTVLPKGENWKDRIRRLRENPGLIRGGG